MTYKFGIELIKEQICDEFGEDIDPSSMLDTELKIMAHLEEICAQ